jgi:hypothetical protein
VEWVYFLRPSAPRRKRMTAQRVPPVAGAVSHSDAGEPHQAHSLSLILTITGACFFVGRIRSERRGWLMSRLT